MREVEGLTAGTYIIHWASVLSNHFDITGFKKVYGDLYKAFYRLPSKLFNFTPLTKYRYFVILIGLPNLLFLLRTSFFGPSTAMVYWNIQCLFASD